MNQVHLIGVVGSTQRELAAPAESAFLLLTERADGAGVDRHRVVLGERRRPVDAFAVGDSVYVRGRLERRRERAVIVLLDGFLLDAGVVPLSAAAATRGGTHRSPLSHERRGHFRRLGAGTPRERLVWVRATTVGGSGPADS